ncbi:MAG: response regulator, partial [Thermoanaerobaculia bacterium]|nr:response regulator [Thermoanaerobaculia bacterium]
MIEDDARLAEMVARDLGASGLEVANAPTAAEGLARLAREPFDLVLLDLTLPDADGLDVCRRLRASGSPVPVIMLTARGDPTDRVVGLELGADDYLGKPFDPRELLARIRAVLRRPASVAVGAPRVLRFGRLEVDADARVARVDGEERAMTAYQFNLLLAMAERAGRVLSREQLMELVKGEVLEAFDRSIDVHVARLRAAIEDDPRSPRRILTVRGAGYVFAR